MQTASRHVRFGVFELDTQSGELRKNGLKLRFAEQPFQILLLLIEKAPSVVTREELRERLWSDDTFVDFDHGLNAAMKRLREALCDSADQPRYIETLPRHGYRFICPLDSAETDPTPAARKSKALPKSDEPRRAPRWIVAVLVVAGAAAIPAGQAIYHWVRAAKAEPIRSLAVLPLENLSDVSAEEYFSDGMTDALISELGQLRALRVVSRHSVMQYKGSTKTIPQIARELGVDAVIEGTAVHEGNYVRISVQLIRAHPEGHIWARSYERPLQDVLALQAEVARDVVIEIRGQLTPQDEARLRSTHSVEAAAQLAYLRGRFFINRWPAPDFSRCAEYLNEATQRDPSYAEAHAALAICYSEMAWTQPPKEIFPKVKAAALKALQIDDSVAEGHLALGSAKLFFDWEWPQAEKELRAAVDLNPSNPLAHVWHSNIFLFTGHFDDAIAEARSAVEMDPASLLTNRNLTFVYMLARRYNDAVAQSKATLALDPANFLSQFDIAWTFALGGSKQQARAEAVRFGFAEHPFFAAPEKHKQALEWIDRAACAPAAGSGRYVDSFYVAMQYAYLGEKDLAFKWLDKAYRDRSAMMVQLKLSPDLDGLRSDPRFQELLQQMKFPH